MYPACVRMPWSAGPERSADASTDAVSLTVVNVASEGQYLACAASEKARTCKDCYSRL